MQTHPMAANSQRFTFTAGEGDFSVYSFTGTEDIHAPYEFVIELVSRDANMDMTPLLGAQGLLTITDTGGEVRHVHGLIRHMEQLHSSGDFTHYRARLVPRLWFLGQTIDHRIFQNLPVTEIITQLLTEHGFVAESYALRLSYEYEPREYCVQYGETCLHFISRLCEEEGIYFYFEHTASGHCLCFADREGGPKITGEPGLRFYRGSGQQPDYAVINRLHLHQQVASNAVAYREWNFTKPMLDLEMAAHEADTSKAPVPEGMLLEQYRYPHLYQKREKGGQIPGTSGKQYADLQLLRQLCLTRQMTAESDTARFAPGFTFSVTEHASDAVNRGWQATHVTHHGEQPQVLEQVAPERGMKYTCTVTAIPDDVRFLPGLDHPKNLVMGQQTGIVTGPQSEEIYPDKYGRVKVQFFWDRKDLWNEKTTCWIRVSQGWAGGQYGMMAIPRVNNEVIVSFLEGNPDRPLITGRVYHEQNMPPYELPAHKTRTVFKSMSTPGQAGEPRGFNELRIEDKKSQEEIYLHAEKDVNIHVKNDWKEHILHDKHETVDNFRYTHIKGEEHLTITQPRKNELLADDHLTVHGNSHTEVKQKWLGKAGEEIHLKSGMKIVIEAGSDLTLKAGGGFIRLTPAGITIAGGAVNINSGGAPGAGTGAAPLLPQGSIAPEVPAPPSAECLQYASEMGAGVVMCDR